MPSIHDHQTQHGEKGRLALDEDDLMLLRDAKANPDALITETPESHKLKLFSVICIIVNRMIGSGIYSTHTTIVRGTDSIIVATIFWVIGCLITLTCLSVYLELGLSIPKYKLRGSEREVSVPRSGGEKNYLEYIFERPKYLAVCVYAVIFICIGNTGGNGITFSEHFLHMCNIPQPTGWAVKGVAVATVTMVCLLHGVWRAGGIYINNVLAVVKVLILMVIIGAGFAAYGGAVPGVERNAFAAESKPIAHSDPYGYVVALLGVMFSYGGAMNANYVLSEVHKPKETLPKGAFTAVGLVSTLYILTTIAYFGVVTKDDLINAENTTVVARVFFSRVFGGHTAAERVLPGLIALSSLGNIIVVTFVGARVKAEIAKEGVLPFSKFFAANSPTLLSRGFRARPKSAETDSEQYDMTPVEQTPVGALLLHWVFSVIIILAPPKGDAYTFFVNLYSYTIDTWIGAVLAGGLLWLRWKPGSTWAKESSFTPWGGPTMAIIYLVFNAFLIIGAFIPPNKERSRLVMKSIRPFIFPTVGTGLFFVGGLYWLGFRFVWPKIYKRELHQTRIPILINDIQVHEIVIFSWVVPGEPYEHEQEHEVGRFW